MGCQRSPMPVLTVANVSPEDAAVRHWLDHSLVLASDYRVSRPDRVLPLLTSRRGALAALGAHHVLVYESTSEPGRILVVIAIHTREPILELLRSRTFFDWFDAVGVEHIPAVFAGELIGRLELDAGRPPRIPEVMVSMVTPVDDVEALRGHVLATAGELRAAGVRKLLTFNAFDDPFELMLLVQIDDEGHANTRLKKSDLAHEWLERAGIGAYPPLFIGRLRGIVRVGEAGDWGRTDDP